MLPLSGIKPRRRPSQSRARMTADSIQDAFLIALLERGYEAVSMRDIAGIAGVGIGTVYLYFPNKESIAAVAVRRCVRSLAEALARVNDGSGPPTLLRRADALVHAYVHLAMVDSRRWAALTLLERRISTFGVYAPLYMRHVDIVRDTLAGASDCPAGLQLEAAAFTIFTIVDGMVRNSIVVQPRPLVEQELTHQIQMAVRGYLLQSCP